MKIPNAENAIIKKEKIKDYLLSFEHPLGRYKASFFSNLGYRRIDWRELKEDIRGQLLSNEVEYTSDTEYGVKYIICGELRGPNRKSAIVVSVWIILWDENTPRLITLYPGERL